MDKLRKNLFNYILTFLGCHEYHVLGTANRYLRKRIMDNKEYQSYVKILRECLDKHLTYEAFLNMKNIEGYINENLFPFVFYGINYLKETEKINIIETVENSSLNLLFSIFRV